MAGSHGKYDDDLSQAVEAAERAGSIVTDHIRSMIDAAQARADEIQHDAQQEAQQIRTEAYEAVDRVLARLDGLEDRLGGLVSGLRQEASSLSGNLGQRG